MGHIIQKELIAILEAAWRALVVTLVWYGLDFLFSDVRADEAYRTAFFVGTTTWYVFYGVERDKDNQ